MIQSRSARPGMIHHAWALALAVALGAIAIGSAPVRAQSTQSADALPTVVADPTPVGTPRIQAENETYELRCPVRDPRSESNWPVCIDLTEQERDASVTDFAVGARVYFTGNLKFYLYRLITPDPEPNNPDVGPRTEIRVHFTKHVTSGQQCYPGGYFYSYVSGISIHSGCTDSGFGIIVYYPNRPAGAWISRLGGGDVDDVPEAYPVVYDRVLDMHPAAVLPQGETTLTGVINEPLRLPLQVVVKNFLDEPVSYPIRESGFFNGLTASIEGPRNSGGTAAVTQQPRNDGVGKVTVTLGSKPGPYTVRVMHEDGVTPAVYTINAVESLPPPPDSDTDQREENGETVDPDAQRADPISIASGNNHHVEVDYPASGLSPIQFKRSFNSLGTVSRTFGNYWTSTYDRYVLPASQPGGPVRLRRPDGTTIVFQSVSGQWVSQPHFLVKLEQSGTGWRFTDRDMSVEEFGSDGKLLKITDLRGRMQTVGYDRSGRLQTVTANTGGGLTFGYDRAGKLSTLTDHTGRAWSYVYDGYSNLKQVRAPSGLYFLHEHKDPVNPWLVTSATLSESPDTQLEFFADATWAYDNKGRATYNVFGRPYEGITSPVSVAYGDDGTRTVSYAQGHSEVFATQRVNGKHFLTGIQHSGSVPSGALDLTRSYDGVMNTTASERHGRTTVFGAHDAKRQIGFAIYGAASPEERRIEFTWDSRFVGKPTSISQPSVLTGRRRVTTITYDAMANPTRITVDGFRPTDGAAIARTNTFEYNGPFGQLSRMDGPRTDVADVTTYAYDAVSKRLQTVTDAYGVVVRGNIVYSSTGKIASEDRPNGLKVIYTYEPGSDRLSSIAQVQGASTHRTTWTYDHRNQVQSILVSDGTTPDQRVTFGYFKDGKVASAQLREGASIRFGQDERGNIDEVSYAAANAGAGRAFSRTFDAFNRLDRLINPNNVYDYDYAPDGTLARVTDGKGRPTEYSYDDLKRLTTVIEPGDVTTTFGYDVADRLISIKDDKLATTRFVYDDLGNQLSVTSPDTGVTTFVHDAAGNVVSSLDAKAQATTYVYDRLNRLTTVDRAGVDYDESFSYDACTNGIGLICSISNSSGETISLQYDGFGRISQFDNDGASVGYVHNGSGELTQLRYPSGRRVHFDRNATGEVEAVRVIEGAQTTYVADSIVHKLLGPAVSWNFGNGRTVAMPHDAQYWPASVASTGVLAVGYGPYDGNGSLLGRTVNGDTQSFTYNPEDRLASSTGGLGPRGYTWDTIGNRLTMDAAGELTAYFYQGVSNRMTGQTGLTYGRDPNGNTISRLASAGGGTHFDYSAHNRLIRVRDHDSNDVIAIYRYNGLGQRSRKTVSGTVTRFTFSLSGELLAERDGSGTIVQEYVYLDGKLIALLGPPSPGGQVPPTFDSTLDNRGMTGDWVSKSDNKATGGAYLYNDQSAQSQSDNHTWDWTVPVAGTYVVHVRWLAPNNSNISQQTYRIQGQVLSLSGQNVARGAWVASAPITLAAGPASLEVSEQLNGTQRLFADAARLVLAAPTLPAPNYVYVHTDAIGVPLAATDRTGATVWRAVYDTFGAAAVLDDVDGNGVRLNLNARLPGHYFDAETSLHYNYFRTYDPAVGRYLESDPIGVWGGLNTFGYVAGSPLMSTDPSGLFVEDFKESYGWDLYMHTGEFFFGGPVNEAGDDSIHSSSDLPIPQLKAASAGSGAAAILLALVKTHKHHSWPKYLGGAQKQIYEILPVKLHEAFHTGLDKILPRQLGTQYYANLTGAAREQALRDFEAYTRAFDAKHGTKLWEAALREGFPAP